METRHSIFRHGIVRTLLGCIFGLAFIATGAGCIPGSVSGGSPDGQTTPVTTALACSATPSGCLCASRNEQPGDLLACSTSSVAVHAGEQGVCCGNATLCTCDAYICKADTSLGFCQCGATAALSANLTGAGVASCPADAAQKCCLLADTHICTCSANDCEGAATSVASCTVGMVAVCDGDGGTPAATSCK
jgi:hypothetical protein